MCAEPSFDFGFLRMSVATSTTTVRKQVSLRGIATTLRPTRIGTMVLDYLFGEIKKYYTSFSSALAENKS